MAFATTYTAGPAPQGAAPSGPQDANSRALKAIEDTWAIAELMRARASAAPPAMADSLARAYQTALKSHREALAHLQRLELASGRLVSANKLAEIEREFITPLAEIFRTMPVELAAESGEFDATRVMEAAQRWISAKLTPILAGLAAAVTVKKSPETSVEGGGGE